MKKTVYICDRCGEEIVDVLYSLRCYAEEVTPGAPGGMSLEAVAQNIRQNLNPAVAHLCGSCKDKLTDGVFIV